MKTTERIRTLARTALLCALAIALSALEGIFTPVLPPGAKAGISNVIVMLAASTLGSCPTLAIVLFKSVFALITRGTLAACFSLGGGLASACLLLLLFRFSRRLGVLGISVAGAFTHSAVQLLLSLALYGKVILAYAPVFLLLSLPSGLLTAAILRALFAFAAIKKRKDMTQ